MSATIIVYSVIGFRIPAKSLCKELPREFPPEFQYDPKTGKRIVPKFSRLAFDELEDLCKKHGLACCETANYSCRDALPDNDYFVGYVQKCESGNVITTSGTIPTQGDIFRIVCRYQDLCQELGIKTDGTNPALHTVLYHG